MGFILISLLILVGNIFFVFFKKASWETKLPFSVLMLIIAILGIFAGIYLPTGGDKPIEKLWTDSLEPLNYSTSSTENGSIFYVSINDNDTYTYYTRVYSEFASENSKAYASETVSGKNVIIVEEEDCQNPRMTKYIQETTTTFWSYGRFGRKEYYVFYVPKGSVAHSI